MSGGGGGLTVFSRSSFKLTVQSSYLIIPSKSVLSATLHHLLVVVVCKPRTYIAGRQWRIYIIIIIIIISGTTLNFAAFYVEFVLKSFLGKSNFYRGVLGAKAAPNPSTKRRGGLRYSTFNLEIGITATTIHRIDIYNMLVLYTNIWIT